MPQPEARKGTGVMAGKGAERGYSDLHEHIEALRDAGLLLEIDREINGRLDAGTLSPLIAGWAPAALFSLLAVAMGARLRNRLQRAG